METVDRLVTIAPIQYGSRITVTDGYLRPTLGVLEVSLMGHDQVNLM